MKTDVAHIEVEIIIPNLKRIGFFLGNYTGSRIVPKEITLASIEQNVFWFINGK